MCLKAVFHQAHTEVVWNAWQAQVGLGSLGTYVLSGNSVLPIVTREGAEGTDRVIY